jgi:Na+-translocating ferredoxin:NAD+ oxidoreductase RnfG subunit
MRKLPGLILISLGLSLACLNANASLSAKVQKRMDKALKKQLGSAMFNRKNIPVENKNLSFKMGNNQLFELMLYNSPKGYVFVEEAMGRYHTFKFMVFVNPELEIENISVLQYDEDYGSEITNKKWLQQFIGYTPQSEFKYKVNIDAISGATISSKSITKGIRDTLQKFKELKEKGYIE